MPNEGGCGGTLRVLSRLGIGTQRRVSSQRGSQPDPWWMRYANTVIVAACIGWSCAIYVWRVCYPMITRHPNALASQRTGIGLLVGFLILWGMLTWSFITVVLSSPGYVHDLALESQPMTSAPSDERLGVAAAPAPVTVLPTPQTTTTPTPVPPSVPLAVPVPIPSQSPTDDDAEVMMSSVRNPIPFSPVDEREARWAMYEQSASGVSHGRDSVSGNESSVMTLAAPPPKSPGTMEPSYMPPPSSPGVEADIEADLPAPTDPRLPKPRRIPPHPPIYASSELYCNHCHRARPPRAHHCRRCGTCVLRMDHHCPWVGGCVGAHNYQYYYNTVLWGFLLSLYVIVSMAPLFARGVRSQESATWAERIRNWNVDGYMISVFVIAAFFFLFTGSLVTVHTYLSGHNLTSIEQRGINSFRQSEGHVLHRYYSRYGQGGTLGWGPVGAFRRFIARRRMLKQWNREWGYSFREGNPWWIGTMDELDYALTSPAAQTRESDLNKTLGLSYSALPTGNGVASISRSATSPLLQHPPFFQKSAFLLNMEQSLGPPYGWFLPVTRRVHTGVHFPLNPRYSSDGVWLPSHDWPPVVHAK